MSNNTIPKEEDNTIPKEVLDSARLVAASEEGKILLKWLRYRFEVDLPVFQKSPGRTRHDDPLYDALIRDGNREVLNYIQALIAKSKNHE